MIFRAVLCSPEPRTLQLGPWCHPKCWGISWWQRWQLQAAPWWHLSCVWVQHGSWLGAAGAVVLPSSLGQSLPP